MITADLTINEVIEFWPAMAATIEEDGIDTCCGGGLSIEEAAKEQNKDLADLLARWNQKVTANSCCTR